VLGLGERHRVDRPGVDDGRLSCSYSGAARGRRAGRRGSRAGPPPRGCPPARRGRGPGRRCRRGG
jgi:hypothetical protein